MSRLKHVRLAPLAGLLVVGTPVVVAAQGSPGFQATTVEVVSELTGQDRGDGSGTYHLVTRVSDPRAGTTIEHDLAADRTVDQEIESSESLVVREGDTERARSGSDPAALGPWADAAIAYVIPFDLEFSAEPRKSYRPRDKQVAELVRGAVPDAKISTRAASDGRTTAVVEVPGVRPVSELAASFVAIRKAFLDAGLGLAKLQLKGQAEIPETAPAAASAAEVGTTQ